MFERISKDVRQINALGGVFFLIYKKTFKKNQNVGENRLLSSIKGPIPQNGLVVRV